MTTSQPRLATACLGWGLGSQQARGFEAAAPSLQAGSDCGGQQRADSLLDFGHGTNRRLGVVP